MAQLILSHAGQGGAALPARDARLQVQRARHYRLHVHIKWSHVRRTPALLLCLPPHPLHLPYTCSTACAQRQAHRIRDTRYVAVTKKAGSGILRWKIAAVCATDPATHVRMRAHTRKSTPPDAPITPELRAHASGNMPCACTPAHESPRARLLGVAPRVSGSGAG